jgi:SAM-dependent methyltransferase
MVTFSEFYESIEPKSDKGTLHDYINGYYSNEFTNNRLNSLNIVEIGVRRGDSLNLLSKWFINSKIVGIDNGKEMYRKDLEFVSKIANTTLILDNAYSDDTINKFQDNSIDYLIDDGPHTIETQIISIQKWLKKVKKGGTLIIEDIQDWNNQKEKFDIECSKLNITYTCIDLRKNKNRYDDVLLVFKK